MKRESYTHIELSVLLLIIFFRPPFDSLLALLTIIVCESKKMMKGVDCSVTRDLTGRVAIVTGGNSGIGKETVLGLAQSGCQVIIAARDEKKSLNAVEEINKLIGATRVCQYPLNLSSKKDIDSFVKAIKEKHTKIDFLINNAGIMMLPERKLTEDGFEMQMGTNHLGHFYLTYKLWDLLKGSDDLRIVNVSSSAHYKVLHQVSIAYDNFHLEKDYGPMRAYGASKLANVLFTQELAERLSKYNPNARCVCLHPGFVRTEIPRYIVKSNSIISYSINPVSRIFGKTPREGAQTTLYAIFQKSTNLLNGAYYNNCQPHSKNPFAFKVENQKRLWQISQEQLGVKFNLE